MCLSPGTEDYAKWKFECDGFVHLRGFFVLDEIEALDEADPGRRERFPKAAHGALTSFSLDPWSARLCLATQPKMVHLAESLLGRNVFHLHVEVFTKEELVGKPTLPHQDGFYLCRNSVGLTIWIALDDVDIENGALTYIRGSHKTGLLHHVNRQIAEFDSDSSSLGEAVLCPAKRGDCLVHHSLTIHYAGENRSIHKRRALGYVYCAAV